MDAFFGYDESALEYRALASERTDAMGDLQGHPVINYRQESIPYTRVAEHFSQWKKHAATVAFREHARQAGPDDVPYYPLRLEGDKAVLQRCVERAEREPSLTFSGRLETYPNLDMHVVIAQSRDLARPCLACEPADWPRFSAPLLEGDAS